MLAGVDVVRPAGQPSVRVDHVGTAVVDLVLTGLAAAGRPGLVGRQPRLGTNRPRRRFAVHVHDSAGAGAVPTKATDRLRPRCQAGCHRARVERRSGFLPTHRHTQAQSIGLARAGGEHVALASLAAAGRTTGIAAGGEGVGLDLLGAALVDAVLPALKVALGDEVARRRVVGLVEVLVAAGVVGRHLAVPGLVVGQRHLVRVGQLPVGLHGVLQAAHGAGVGEDVGFDGGADVVLAVVPAVAELVDAGRAEEEAPELGADGVDRGVHLAGGQTGLHLRFGLRGLVGFKHPKIGHGVSAYSQLTVWSPL